MTALALRAYGPALEVAGPDRLAPSPDIVRALEAEFVYVHRVMAPGGGRGGPRVELKPYSFCVPDTAGRIILPSGFLDRVEQLADRQGWPHTRQVIHERRPEALEPDWDRLLKINYTFSPGQAPLFEAMVRRVLDGVPGGGVVHVPPGVGKTRALLPPLVLLFRHARILVVVPGRDLLNDVARLLLQYLPSVGRVGGGKRDDRDPAYRVLVCSSKSLHLVPPGWADLIVADECHRLVSNSFAAPLAEVALNAVRLGMSATLKRQDGWDARLEGLFGPVIAHMTYQEAVSLGLVLPIEVLWLPVDLAGDPVRGTDLSGVALQRTAIWRNEVRNRLAAELAARLPADRPCLYLVASVEHALRLQAALKEVLGYDVPAAHAQPSEVRRRKFVQWGLVDEDWAAPTSEQREQLRREFERGAHRVVVANDVWFEGVSFPALGYVVRCDARVSHRLCIQGSTRVNRRNRDDATKQVGYLIDFDDRFHDKLHRATLARAREYAEQGWTQAWRPTKH